MVASCWLFLNDLYYDARIQEHQVAFFLPVRCFLSVGWICTSLYKSFIQDYHSSTVCPVPLSV